MSNNDFTIEDLKMAVSEIFDIEIHSLQNDSDLTGIIKDSIDFGELVAFLKNRFVVEPKDWETFKTAITVEQVFNNFEKCHD